MLDSCKEKMEQAKELVMSNPDTALLLLEEAKDILKFENQCDIIAYYNIKSKYFWQKQQFDSALAYSYPLAATLPVTGDCKEEIVDVNTLTGIFFYYQSKIDSALKYTHKALDLAMIVGNEEKIAKANHNLSLYYSRQNNYTEAFSYKLDAVRYYEKVSTDTSELINIYRSLGALYRKQKKFDEALAIYEKVLNLSEQINNDADYSNTCHSIFLLYRSLKEDEKALKYLNLGMAKAKNNNIIMSNWYYIKCDIFIKSEQYDSALYYFQKSIKTDPIRITQHANENLNTYAILYLNKKNYDSASYYANKMIENAKETNNQEWVSIGYRTLSTINTQQKDFAKALDNYKLSMLYEDSVFNLKNSDKIETLKIEYETEKKDAELIAINKQNELINKSLKTRSLLLILAFFMIVLVVIYMITLQMSRRKILEKNIEITEQKKAIDNQNEMLNEHVKTKDKFFSIISHDLRGPMGTQMALIAATLEKYNELTDSEKIDILTILKESSKKSYDFMNNLLEWSRTQRGVIKSNPEMIDSKVIADNVINVSSSRAGQKNQSLINAVNLETIVFADKNILNVIFNNLINNAIKFTPVGGKIEISAISKEKEVLFCVSDSGIGIPEEKIKTVFRVDNDFKRVGTSDEPGSGLGLVIVKEFVTLLKGQVWAESEVGVGTKFYFTIPTENPTPNEDLKA